MKIQLTWIALAIVASGLCHADESACAAIRAANKKSGSKGVTVSMTGYNFAMDVPDIYGVGTHTCTHLRNEIVSDQPASVFREQYQSKAGSTDATIWIAVSTGRLLKEEQDGEITGKARAIFPTRGQQASRVPNPMCACIATCWMTP